MENTNKKEKAITIKTTAAQNKAIAEIREKTDLVITNGKLATLTLEIAKLIEKTTQNYNALGAKLEQVQTEKLYKADFGTFAQYVQQAFGIRKTVAYGAIKVHQQLYKADGEQFAAKSIGNLNDTQLLALTNIDGDNTTPESAEKIALEIGIAKSDTSRQIAEKVKAYKDGKDSGTETEGEAEESNATEIAVNADYEIAKKAIKTAVNKIIKINDMYKRADLIAYFTALYNKAIDPDEMMPKVTSK